MEQSFQDGYHQGQAAINQIAQQLRADLNQRMNAHAAHVRRSTHEQLAHLSEKLGELEAISKALSISGSGLGQSGSSKREEGNLARQGMVRIEDIPGRRTPYTLIIEIPIQANDTSVREGSYPISMDGPFVAVRRMACFQSAHATRTTDPTTGDTASFSSRSFGRFRPVSSAWDLLDSQHNAVADTATWWLTTIANGDPAATALPGGVLGMPSNISSFRTMEFDGKLEVMVAGSQYPRQNINVPSAFWSASINAPWDLAALDFWERGETVTVKVTPTHANNPGAGNVDGSFVFPVTQDGGTGWPFLDGQYDAHEGIATPAAATIGEIDPDHPNLLATDSVTRLPSGFVIVGFEGYRINQPIGVAL
jgi:hypothetical protein